MPREWSVWKSKNSDSSAHTETKSTGSEQPEEVDGVAIPSASCGVHASENRKS